MAGLQPILPAVNMAFFGLAGASLRLVGPCTKSSIANHTDYIDACSGPVLIMLLSSETEGLAAFTLLPHRLTAAMASSCSSICCSPQLVNMHALGSRKRNGSLLCCGDAGGSGDRLRPDCQGGRHSCLQWTGADSLTTCPADGLTTALRPLPT